MRRPENIDARRRQERAYALFIAGLTYQQIADSPDDKRPGKPLYGDRGAAHKAVKAAMERHVGADEVEEMRQVEALRLDALQRAHWAKAMQGVGWDTDRVLQIMDQRARLFGLRKPERKQIEVITSDTVQAAIDELTRQIAEGDAAEQALAAQIDGIFTEDGDVTR
jgi:hypothetical protein